MLISINFPDFIPVPVPAFGGVVMVASPTTEEDVLNIVTHGLKQRLGDAAAGKSGEAARKAVTAKNARYLYAPAGTRGSHVDPVDVQLVQLVKTKHTVLKIKKSDVPAASSIRAYVLATFEEKTAARLIERATEMAEMASDDFIID